MQIINIVLKINVDFHTVLFHVILMRFAIICLFRTYKLNKIYMVYVTVRGFRTHHEEHTITF